MSTSSPDKHDESQLSIPTRGLAVHALVFAWLLMSDAFAQPLQPLMGDPLPGLTSDERRLFEAGRSVFDQFLAAADGLGPAFNDFSCGLCHEQPTSGGFSERTVTLFGRRGPPFDPMIESGGPLLQAQATLPSCVEYIPPDAEVVALRATPHLFGLGLVELIPDHVLLAQRAVAGGRAHMVRPLEGGPPRVGRFGWKSQIATILSFSADAARNELGLTNALLPQESAAGGDAGATTLCDPTPDPEDRPDAEGYSRIERMTHFQRMLAPPPQTPRSGMTGETIFERIGCADCHRPRFSVRANTLHASDSVELRPYSDFLLHDLGAFSDGYPQGEAGPTEMRTAPLWGLSHRIFLGHDAATTGDTFEDRVAKVIVRHGGKATHSSRAYAALNPHDRDLLLAFLQSLGRAEFDHDNNHRVDSADWETMFPAVNGPLGTYVPDDPASISDIDQDGDVDMVDVGAFQRAMTSG